MSIKILVIEDDYNIQELLRYNLESNGYEVIAAVNGNEGYKMALNNSPDVILLDVMIPGADGLEVCKMIRMNEKIKRIPILMVTAKSEELDKILGLELGADDYITKPFSIKELIARIKAVMRRFNENKDATEEKPIGNKLVFRNLEIDGEKYEVKIDGKKVVLTLKEFELLKILAESPGRVMTRDFLLDNVWGYEYIGGTRTVDVHIRHLRQKLWEGQGEGMIQTIRGVGYKFDDSGEL